MSKFKNLFFFGSFLPTVASNFGHHFLEECTNLATVNQHPPVHYHPLDVHYDSVVDEPSQLSQYLVSSW